MLASSERLTARLSVSLELFVGVDPAHAIVYVEAKLAAWKALTRHRASGVGAPLASLPILTPRVVLHGGCRNIEDVRKGLKPYKAVCFVRDVAASQANVENVGLSHRTNLFDSLVDGVLDWARVSGSYCILGCDRQPARRCCVLGGRRASLPIVHRKGSRNLPARDRSADL